MMNKKAVSPVITTILLILVAMAAVGIIAGFVIPFIRENLRGDCFQAIEQIEIDAGSKYTCYRTIAGEDGTLGTADDYFLLTVSVKRGAKPLGIESFKITVFGGGSSNSFDIREPSTPESVAGKVAMLGGGQILEVPKVGEMRTYQFNITLPEITSAELYPVVGGRQCNEADRKLLYEC